MIGVSILVSGAGNGREYRGIVGGAMTSKNAHRRSFYAFEDPF